MTVSGFILFVLVFGGGFLLLVAESRWNALSKPFAVIRAAVQTLIQALIPVAVWLVVGYVIYRVVVGIIAAGVREGLKPS
jgi:hypothetical protein